METIENENLAIGPLFVATGVCTFVVIASFFFLDGMMNAERDALIQDFQEQRPAAAMANEAVHAERLTTYKAIDKETGHFQVPVERAMELVIKERSSK
jgi:hypothetical protein